MDILTIKVPFFDHGTQGFCFYYLPNIEAKWNKFKWKILHDPNYDNFHGGGDFHMCMWLCINILVKNHKCKKYVHKLLYTTLHVFLHENFLHILLTVGVANSKANGYKNPTKWKKKNHFPCCPFRMDVVAFKKIILYII